MKAQRYHSLGLAVLGSLLVLLSGSNVVAMSSSSSPLLDCTEASTGDGDCDLSNNTEECDYDGGDCCECTCVSTTQYVCGVRSGFSCLDPGASCFVDDGSNAATAPPASDGFPEGTLTPTPATVSTEAPTITASTEAPFITTPTEAPSITTPAEETATTFPTAGSSTASSSCIPGSLSDGSCDSENNNEECGYDGGDCCECACVSTSEFTCGENDGYDCVDPESSCEELSVEGRSSAYRTAHTSSPVCWQLAMCFFVLSLRRLSQQ